MKIMPNIKKIKTEAQDYLNAKMNNMTTSDRVKASREGKRLILVINEFFKSTNEKSLMDLMKAITVKKKKIEEIISKFLGEKGLKLSDIIQYIRAMITGLDVSPRIYDIMEILGFVEIKKRIENFING